MSKQVTSVCGTRQGGANRSRVRSKRHPEERGDCVSRGAPGEKPFACLGTFSRLGRAGAREAEGGDG